MNRATITSNKYDKVGVGGVVGGDDLSAAQLSHSTYRTQFLGVAINGLDGTGYMASAKV